MNQYSQTSLPPRAPKGGRPTQEIAAQLGTHILEVALEQFIAHGAGGITMDAIASAAKISKRTLYSRFRSKTELVRSAVEHGVGRLISPIVALTPCGTLRERLFHTGRKFLDTSLMPEVIGMEALIKWLQDNECPMVGAGTMPGISDGVGHIRSILEDSELNGSMPEEDMDFFARYIFDSMVTIPRHMILCRRDIRNTAQEKNQYLDHVLDILLWGRTAE